MWQRGDQGRSDRCHSLGHCVHGPGPGGAVRGEELGGWGRGLTETMQLYPMLRLVYMWLLFFQISRSVVASRRPSTPLFPFVCSTLIILSTMTSPSRGFSSSGCRRT